MKFKFLFLLAIFWNLSLVAQSTDFSSSVILLPDDMHREEVINAEKDHYKKMVSKITSAATHPTLTLSLKEKEPYFRKGVFELSENKKLGYVFKRKYSRILEDGKHVEWLWCLDLLNKTEKKFFSSGKIIRPDARFKIDILNKNNEVISSCIYYTDIMLDIGEKEQLHGKWVIPYDKISSVAGYKIQMGF